MRIFISEKSTRCAEILKDFTEFDVPFHSKSTLISLHVPADVGERVKLLKLRITSTHSPTLFEVTPAVMQISNTCDNVQEAWHSPSTTLQTTFSQFTTCFVLAVL